MKAVVLLSGGLDSSTLLHYHLEQGDEVRALFVYYGQRHAKEAAYARWQAQSVSVPLVEVPLQCLRELLPGSSQTDASVPVPEGHYAEESMKLTVVPNRNMILLSLAIGHAVAHKMDVVSYAAHSGDHAVYPDCRAEFVDVMKQAAMLCDWHPVDLISPFVHKTKADLVRIGYALGMNQSLTWSCYVGREHHCGKCGTCIERREAFHLADVEDPTVYESGAPKVEELLLSGWKL